MNKQELRERMSGLPEPPNDSHPPLWDFWRHDLWQRVVNGEDPDGFMGWPCVYHTMLQNHWPLVVGDEFREMYRDGGFDWIYAAHVMDSPKRFYPADLHSGSTPSLSRNLIHQAYHLLKWQQATGEKVADLNTIVEFGGGYGAMALVAHRMDFQGSYRIVDLPEFSLLQEYFLDATAPELFKSLGRDRAFGKRYEVSLVVAGYSLSETDYSERDQFIWNNPADSYLIWYSNKFEDYDNIAYFQERLPSMQNQMTWKHWRAEHMPPETHYTVGWRK